MFSYEIKNGKVIFCKAGVYFSVPIEDWDNFYQIVKQVQDLILEITD